MTRRMKEPDTGRITDFDSEEERQRYARKQGYRGVCIICETPIDKSDNYALIYSDGGLSDAEGPAHEECLVQWQNPPETPDKE